MMNILMSLLTIIVIYLMPVLVGAWCTSSAIKNFNKKNYFMFGADLIMAITCIVFIAGLIIP